MAAKCTVSRGCHWVSYAAQDRMTGIGRQQDAGIAFGEIHLNHGASIFNRLFARVDGRGIMSHLGSSRRSPGWIGTAAINASCKIAVTRGTSDTCLPSSASVKPLLTKLWRWNFLSQRLLMR
jgi:hypothetical protein